MTLAVVQSINLTTSKIKTKLNYWEGIYEFISDRLREYDWASEFKDKSLEENWKFFRDKVTELVH